MVKIQDGYRILFIGDSITDIRFNRRFAYKIHGPQVHCLQATKELKKKCKNLKFFYRGVASNRTYHLYDRLTRDCIELKPDVIIMLIGVNDAWENYVPEQYPPLVRPMKPHMQEIYRRLNAELSNAQILVLLPFLIDTIEEKLPFHKTLNEFREQLREMAEENGAQIVDLQKEFDVAQQTIPSKKLSVDGVHPTNLGHKVISKAVLNAIE